jgi:tRNA(Arg) A34 adenosine deaminase TadA
MNEPHMRRALALACESVASGGGPFGAVVVRDGQVIAEGINRVTVWNDPTAHAEVVAVRNACSALGRFDLRGCQVYSSCEPCPMCLGALHWARVDTIYYSGDRYDAARAGFDDAVLYDEFVVPIEQRSTPIHRLLPEQAAMPFDAWLRVADRTAY